MILALNIGNSNITFGSYTSDGKLVFSSRLFADTALSSDELLYKMVNMLALYGAEPQEITAIIFSSVVPALTPRIREALRKMCEAPVMEVGPGLKSGVRIRMDNPAQLGGELLCAVVGALRRAEPPLVVVNFDTATTLLAVDDTCALVGGACFLGGRWSAGRSETAKIDTVVLQNQLSEIRELATVTYAYTNMAQFESSNDFYGVKMPFTTKSFILPYDGTVKAGVDLDGAEVSVSGTTVTITLPEAEILSHEIDEDSMEVFDEKTSIFNPFTVEDFTSFQSDQKAAMEEKALSRGLLAEARAKAVSSVEQLFAAALPDTYTVTVQ